MTDSQIDISGLDSQFDYNRKLVREAYTQRLKSDLTSPANLLLLDQIISEKTIAARTLREVEDLIKQIVGAEGHNQLIIDYTLGLLKNTLKAVE